MHDVMLDLETMGTGPRAAIVAIGAVEFDPDTGTVGERFYRAVDLATSVSMGGEMDASTVLWWMQQGDEARAAFAKGGMHLSKALMDFSMWLHERGTTDNLRVWGNGAALDNVILASAYRAAMQVQPWRHWNDRCYRTIKAQHPGVKMERTGVHHNAADDAESQARHLVAMLKGPNALVSGVTTRSEATTAARPLDRNVRPRLLHGDCLDVMRGLPDGSIDMVLADLPFGTTRQTWDKVIDMPALWKEYRRVTKPNAAILLFAKPPFDKVLACSNLPMYRYDWIWEKTRATGHLNANRMPLQAHECICVFYRQLPEYHPQKTTGHAPVNAFYTRHSGACYGDAETARAGGGNTDRYPRSVLRYAPVPNTDRLHPNQKPVDLLKDLILTYTSPGQTVLDNTAGSGSTLVACMETGRHGIGIEKDPVIYGRACDRVAPNAS